MDCLLSSWCFSVARVVVDCDVVDVTLVLLCYFKSPRPWAVAATDDCVVKRAESAVDFKTLAWTWPNYNSQPFQTCVFLPGDITSTSVNLTSTGKLIYPNCACCFLASCKAKLSLANLILALASCLVWRHKRARPPLLWLRNLNKHISPKMSNYSYESKHVNISKREKRRGKKTVQASRLLKKEVKVYTWNAQCMAHSRYPGTTDDTILI